MARRVAATAQLAAQEYRVGVVDGRVVAKAEVEEAALFLQGGPPLGRLSARGDRRAGHAQRSTHLLASFRAPRPPIHSTPTSGSLTEGLTRRLGVRWTSCPR